MKLTLKVALDTTDRPPVIVNPAHPEVERGKHQLEWLRTGDVAFTFKAFAPSSDPFSNVKISDQKITADYENKHAGEVRYIITVTSDGRDYSSAFLDANGNILTGGSTIKNR
jgi:hypothetical protein